MPCAPFGPARGVVAFHVYFLIHPETPQLCVLREPARRIYGTCGCLGMNSSTISSRKSEERRAASSVCVQNTSKYGYHLDDSKRNSSGFEKSREVCGQNRVCQQELVSSFHFLSVLPAANWFATPDKYQLNSQDLCRHTSSDDNVVSESYLYRQIHIGLCVSGSAELGFVGKPEKSAKSGTTKVVEWQQ